MEDAQIVELFFARSEDAISELDQKYGKLYHKLADNILKSAQDAEECVNDAYLSTWNAIPPQRPESLSAFVGTLVRRCSITRYRANTASKHIPSPMLVYPATVGNRTSMVVTQHSAANIALRTSIRMVSFLFFIPEYLSC